MNTLRRIDEFHGYFRVGKPESGTLRRKLT